MNGLLVLKFQARVYFDPQPQPFEAHEGPAMNLSAIPRVSLAHLPTPLEPLPRLSAHLGGPTIYIKRDDQTMNEWIKLI